MVEQRVVGSDYTSAAAPQAEINTESNCHDRQQCSKSYSYRFG